MPEDTYTQSFEEYLGTIPANSTLFDVYATDLPTELGGTEKLIAHMVTQSDLVTSNWGDEHMFFRHQRMDDDLKLRPEWEPYTPNPKPFRGFDGLVDKIVSTCPFAYLWQ